MASSMEWKQTWKANSLLFRRCFYLDPNTKSGLTGHENILPYFTKLLKNNPNWKWTYEEIIPTEKGFILKWKAVIPVGKNEIIEYGLDIVEIENDKIIRNEVYFDTLKLINAILEKNKKCG